MFSTSSKRNFSILATFSLSSANAFNLDHSKILSRDKGLNDETESTLHILWQFNVPSKKIMIEIESPEILNNKNNNLNININIYPTSMTVGGALESHLALCNCLDGL